MSKSQEFTNENKNDGQTVTKVAGGKTTKNSEETAKAFDGSPDTTFATRADPLSEQKEASLVVDFESWVTIDAVRFRTSNDF